MYDMSASPHPHSWISSYAMWGGQSWPQPPFQAALRAAMRTRPLEILSSRRQSRRNRILLDVLRNPPHFISRSDQMIVALILPERTSCSAQYPISLISGEAFERRKPFRRSDARGHKNVDVVRHHHEGMKFVATETAFPFPQRVYHQRSNVGALKKSRTGFGTVEQAIHGNERFTGSDLLRWKHSIRRKAAVKAEGDKQGVVHDIPMRQAALVMSHLGIVGSGGEFSQSAGRMAAAEPAGKPAAAKIGRPTTATMGHLTAVKMGHLTGAKNGWLIATTGTRER
jgi:hypothetical protein